MNMDGLLFQLCPKGTGGWYAIAHCVCLVVNLAQLAGWLWLVVHGLAWAIPIIKHAAME